VSDRYIVVRRPCCGWGIGRIIEPAKIVNRFPEGAVFTCLPCGGETDIAGWLAMGYPISADGELEFVWPLEWLRKLPPLAELEAELDEATA